MYVSRSVIVALVSVGPASVLSDTASDNLRGSRGLQHVADNGLSESFDDIDADGIGADNIDKRTGINPDSGDEDYRVQDWVEDPSYDADAIGADSMAKPYNYTDYEWTYDGPPLSEPGNGLPPGSLNVCEGDCDDDIDCAAGLVCWYEDGSGKVPGCSGTPREYWEYCIDPSVLPKRDVTHSNTLMDFGDATGPASLGHCQGDCDYDIDCEGNNVCFYADGTGVVPGCDGTPTPSWEYCADPETIKEHRAKIGLENLESTDGYCPASIPYEGRVEMGKVNATIANEVSGMVNGRRNPNVLYVHNDRNNAPRLMAIDKNNGRIVQNWNIGGINHTDYEDISNGPGPKAGVNYLHLCDIGDNPWDRQTIWIHRLPEPALTGPIGPKTFYPQTLTLRYPDGPKNAESCMVDPLTGLIYIIQKTRRTAQIYKTEKPWGDGDEMMDLVMAGTVTNLRKPARWGNALTGIDISPNGRDIAMLYYGGLDYRCRDENESIEDALGRFGLLVPSYIEEPNGGEAIAFASDMSGLYSCQEGGYDPEVPLYRYPATVAGLLTGRASNATPEPSMKPTNAPTKAPTAAPTEEPTVGPTSAPTISPTTANPTPSPTTGQSLSRTECVAKGHMCELDSDGIAIVPCCSSDNKCLTVPGFGGRCIAPDDSTLSPGGSPVSSSPTSKLNTAPVTSEPSAKPTAAPVVSEIATKATEEIPVLPTLAPPTPVPPTFSPPTSVPPTPVPPTPVPPTPVPPTYSPPTPVPPTPAPPTPVPPTNPPPTLSLAEKLASLFDKTKAEGTEAEEIKDKMDAAELKAKMEEEKKADDVALRTEDKEEIEDTPPKTMEEHLKDVMKWQEKWNTKDKSGGSKKKDVGSKPGDRKSAGSKPFNRKSGASKPFNRKSGASKPLNRNSGASKPFSRKSSGAKPKKDVSKPGSKWDVSKSRPGSF